MLGFDQVRADDVGSRGGRLDKPGGGHVDGGRAAPFVDQLDQAAVGAFSNAWRHAAADRHEDACADRGGDSGHNVAPFGVAQRRPRLVDDGGAAGSFDHHGRATQLATNRYGRDGESLGLEQVDGNGAEPAGERADEVGWGAQGHGGPADVHRLAARRDHRIGGAEHLTGSEHGELDRAVDRLVETDDEHQTPLPPW